MHPSHSLGCSGKRLAWYWRNSAPPRRNRLLLSSLCLGGRGDHSTPSSSLSREKSLPRKEPSGGSGAQATHPPPTTVWGARGWSFPRQRPRRWVDMKRPYRPAASDNPGLSWPLGRNEESRFTATRRGHTAKAFLPASNCSPHSKPSQPPLEAWRAGSVHSHLFSVWQLGDALSFPRYSLSFRRQRAACVGTQSILPCSVRTLCWPPVSPALHTPSTRTRMPRALLRGGGCRCSEFGPATHFSLGKIPPASTGFNWR